MSSEVWGLVRDLSRYARFGLERVIYPRLGRGVDYESPIWRDQAARAVERIHPREMRLSITEILDETPSTKTIRFVRQDAPLPPFRAGQYVNLHVEISGLRTCRPYSISSPPHRAYLDITVRDKPGGFVAPWLVRNLRVGDTLTSSGPSGTFYHEPLCHGDDLVFIAGGSGITPFMSMIRHQDRRLWPQRVHLIYGSRSSEDVIFGAELAELAAERRRFSYTLVISEPHPGHVGPTGLLDLARLRAELGFVEGRTFYVCGPAALYDLCGAALAEMGVAPQRIRREVYGPPADVTKAGGWPAEVSVDTVFHLQVEGGPHLAARAGEPIMSALERGGVAVPALCRSGQCSACRTRILRGRVFEPPSAFVRESDRAHGYVHACVTYPLSDLLIRF